MNVAYYATLDLKDAYFQIVFEEGCRYLTTFLDGVSLYRIRRLPFGLSCAPDIREGWVKKYHSIGRKGSQVELVQVKLCEKGSQIL